MESGSQSDNSPGRSSNRVAEIIGALIALLTLTLPLTIISHYSSNGNFLPPTTNRNLTRR